MLRKQIYNIFAKLANVYLGLLHFLVGMRKVFEGYRRRRRGKRGKGKEREHSEG